MSALARGVGLLAYFVRHRTAANLVLLAMLLGGVYGALNIRAQFFPDIVVETVTVSVAWPGAGPEDVDGQVVAVLEPLLLAVEGVSGTTATAREGRASIVLEFEPGWDMSRAADEVGSTVDAADALPETIDRPVVRRGAFRDRVTDVILHGPVPVEQLARFAVEFQALLFAEGVSRTGVDGAADPLIRIDAPEAMLIRHDLSLREIADAVGAAAASSPAGDVGAGGGRVRAGVERRTAEALGGVVVRMRPGGERLHVRDVARVSVDDGEAGTALFVGDRPAVRVRVDRSEQGDAIQIQNAAQRAADALRATLPEGVSVDLTRTRAQMITDRLNLLVSNGVTGLALVLAFLFLFLSARTAFWVAMGIPAAMAAAVGLMYLTGLSLNMISLFALIICLGIVVDDAIVVGEHADMLARRGMGATEAAETAARRMLGPVFAASVTTVIAFLAIAVIGGRMGSLIFALPLTVAMVVIASLIESFVVLPAHMRHALSAKSHAPWYDWPSRQVDRGFRWFRDRAFRPFLRFVVWARYPAIGASVSLLLWSITLLTTGTVPWRFFDSPERGVVTANFAMLPGATREDSREMLAEMNRALDAVNARFAAEHGAPPVVFALGSIGEQAGRGMAAAATLDGDLVGGLAIELIDPDFRPYTQNDFIRAWRDEVGTHPRLETLSLRGERSGPAGDAISVAFTGTEVRALKAAAEDLKTALAPLAAVTGLEDTLAFDKEELILSLTPRGEALGFTTASLGRELRDRLSGIEAAEFPWGTRAATVEVRLPEDDLGPDYLDRALVRTPEGRWVALSEVVTVERTLGFASIRREDGFPVVTVTGEIAEDDAGAAAEVRRLMETEILPEIAARHAVAYRLTGLAEQERDFLSDAALGFTLCLIGIYVALAWVFGSWSRPLVVLLVVPFGLIGVLWGHHWMGAALSMFSVVGMLGMTGIIINDAIVLVTTVDDYAARRALIPALIDAAADRLRAVFLTTATTVAGLTPLLFETSTQAQFLKPTVITLAFGLGFGMVLVLIVTPAALAIQHDMARAGASGRRLIGLWRQGRRMPLGGRRTA
ncbi:MAG: efflux RND transporter permease subunit [Rhodobacteraceae bacterium]|nr:MAG: efflux RND transporter permease subunit [Paracoccaceae bacterium]